MNDTSKAFLGGMAGGVVAVGILGLAGYLYINYRIQKAKEQLIENPIDTINTILSPVN